jgi:hypothetical protein
MPNTKINITSMTRINSLLWLAVSLTMISLTISVHAQNTTQLTQWFVPLDLGKELKIKCNGSLVDFVSDCTSPANCKSLRQAGNDMLECIPDSKFKNSDEQVIFP